MRIVDVHDVWVKYKGSATYALRGVSVTVDEGEVLGIIGPTGAGKTTLAKVMCGIVPNMGAYDEFRGEVTVGGQTTIGAKIGDISKTCAMVFQDYESQLFRTTVQLEAAFGPENLMLHHDQIKQRVDSALRLTGLTGLETRYSFALSGGQKQRLAIASMLSLQPQVLVLDEATSDLDPVGKHMIYEVARRLIDEGVIKSMVLIDHHLEKVAQFAHRVIVLQNGKVIAEGDTMNILSDVEGLTSIGMRPPETAVILGRIKPGEKPYPMTVQEAVERFPTSCVFRKAEDSKEPLTGDAVRVRDLWFAYEPGEWVTKGVNLTIKSGESVGLIGQNGSGKTTLAQLIMGILKVTRGSVEIFGRDVTRYGVGVRGREVGYVFQNPDYQIFSRTVADELQYGLKAANLPPPEIERRVKNISDLMGISHLLDEDPFFLTKADRQRVAVGSVLTMEPKVLILDEPTTGLAPGETTALMDTVMGLNRRGMTVVTITHDMWVVAKYCKRTVLMSEGKVELDAPTREIFSQADLLAKYNIEVPQVVRLGQTLFDVTYLTPDEFLANVMVT